MAKIQKISTPKKNISVTQPHTMVCVIEASLKGNEELLFFLASDLHLDHPKCNRQLLKTHLDECVAKNGFIIFNGDILCVMQGKNDKRHSKSSVRAEDMNDAYFDSVVENAVEFLLPYAKHILFMGVGNHETAILKRVEVNLLRRMIELIFYKTGHRIALGQYHGWIYIRGRFEVSNRGKTSMDPIIKYLIYHNHGSGGDSPVTGGSIEDNRKMTHVEGEDAIWMGHNHNKYDRQQAVHFLCTKSMKAKLRIIENIRTGTYKQEYTGQGWHIETNKSPKPLGGTWLQLKGGYSTETNGRCFFPKIWKTWHDEIEITE